MKVKVGDTVYFQDYNRVEHGQVIATIEKQYGSEATACIKTRDSFKVIQVDPRFLFLSVHECTLVLANKKQQEAAKLLSEAAELFTKAGGMKEDVQESSNS
jgi:hypothetical protein